MNRRSILGMAAIAATVAALNPKGAAAHEGHHHETNPALKALFTSANECASTAQLCQAHCQEMFASGDRSLADCSRSVDALVPVCQTLAALAAQNSRFLPHYAKLAAEICRACEKDCRKHEKDHSQCHDCAEACARCAKNCDAVAA
jgi:Cys-rich four helix bundle protein (predicted Tat secretion target)